MSKPAHTSKRRGLTSHQYEHTNMSTGQCRMSLKKKYPPKKQQPCPMPLPSFSSKNDLPRFQLVLELANETHQTGSIGFYTLQLLGYYGRGCAGCAM